MFSCAAWLGPPRRLNLVFLGVLITVGASLTGTIYLVRESQVRRNASVFIERARRAEAGGDLERAQDALARYLRIRHDDGTAWRWYARLVDERDTDHLHRGHVYLAHVEALRYNPGDWELERRCADLALEMDRFGDAERHLRNLLERTAKSAAGQTGSIVAELEDLLAQCSQRQSRYDQAEEWYTRALSDDPARVDCYDRLARLRRTELRRIESADSAIRELVAKNPNSGRAYAHRWRYARSFGPPPLAAPADITRALDLAPDDPEVLLAAAVACEEKQDAALARAYLERGSKLYPENTELVLALALLETREQHLERAEAILRQASRNNHAISVAFLFASVLIQEDKIDGKDQARDVMADLQRAGLGNTLVRFLEAEILIKRQRWREAIPALEMARALLGGEPQLVVQLDVRLAECYGRTGDEENRLDALRQAAGGGRGSESARIELARTLVRFGRLDQAVTALLPLASRKPEWRLDLVRLLLERTIRQPRDQRNWHEVEEAVREAEQALPRAVEPLTLVRADLLVAQGKVAAARTVLSDAIFTDQRNLRYRMALARLCQSQGEAAAALEYLDQAERDLGPRLEILLARLDHWSLESGTAGETAVAKLAAGRQHVAPADRPHFLDRLGRAEIRLGQLDLARQYWRELAALQSENIGVRLALLDLALAAGDQADAARLVDQIRKLEGEQGTIWRFARTSLLLDRVRRGASAVLNDAQQLADEIVRRRPTWVGGVALKGEIAELAGSVDQAISLYLRAIELGNVQPSLVRRLTRLLHERGRLDRLEDLARMLREQGAAVDEVRVVQVLDAIRGKNIERGLALARRAFPESSSHAFDHLMLGRLYMAAGRRDAAGQEFERAVELGPGLAEAWLTHIQFLVRSDRLDRARIVAQSARRALTAGRSPIALAECSLMLGELQQAETLIAAGLKERPRDPTALRVAADIALAQRQPEKVKTYLKELDRISTDSPNDRAWANRTRAALLLDPGGPQDRAQALSLVEQNLKNRPDSVEDQELKAVILARSRARRGEAIEILERLAGEERLPAGHRFLLAQLDLVQRDERNYERVMQKLLSSHARTSQHLAHYTRFLIDRNRLDEADHWLAELKKGEPNGPLALELEARLLFVRQQKPEARTLLEAHGRRFPDQIGLVASLLDDLGFEAEAEAAYKAFIARDRSRPDRLLALAQFFARRDRVSEAMSLLTRAWPMGIPDQVAAVALAVYDAPSSSDVERRQVEAWVTEAVKRRPDAVLLAAKLGVIRIREGRVSDAEQLLRGLLTRNPENADALNALAWLLAMQDPKKTEEAQALIDRAIELVGPNASLLDTRAVVRIRAGQPGKAIDDLIAVHKAEPANAASTAHLGWAYQMSGQPDLAKTAFHKAGELGWRLANVDPLERAVLAKLAPAQ